MADEQGLQLRKQGLRDTNLGATLRVPMPKSARLDGTNSWTGANSFTDLNVYNLVVYQSTLFLHSAVTISASVSSFFGTLDPQDMWIGSSGIARLGITSAGWYIFASSQPSSVFTTVLFTDAFTRADAYPLDAWTTQAGASALRLSANAVHASAGGALAIGAGYPTSDTWDLSAADAQVLISGNGATTDRCGVSVFMASGGASGYDVVFQQNVDQIQIRKRTSPTADASLGSFASQGHFGTLRAVASAYAGSTSISAFKNGTYVGVGTASTVPYTVGFAGIRMGSDNPATGNTLADNFEHNSTTAPPFATGDIVLQTSASLWDMLGATGATKHAQVFNDSFQLGFSKPVIFTGLTSAFVSAGTSAYFNSATYGVVRLASAAGTTGLSGVVGLSGTGGVQPSAVGNDVVWLKQDIFGLSAVGTAVSGASGVVALSGVNATVSAIGAATIMISAGGGSTAVGLRGFQNLRGAQLAGASASANFYLTADAFQVATSTNAIFVGTNLAVSASLASSGANGRDVSASLPAPSWAYFYVVSGTGGVAGLWSSAVPSAGPVLPVGYDAWAFAHANYIGAASALSAMRLVGDFAWYEISQVTGSVRILAAGAATTFTTLQASSFFPPITTYAHIAAQLVMETSGGVNSFASWRPTGSSLVSGGFLAQAYIATPAASGRGTNRSVRILLNSVGQFDYAMNPNSIPYTNGIFLDAEGFQLANGAV